MRPGVALGALLATAAAARGGPSPPQRLRVEYMADPLGVDVAQPRFSWALHHTDRGAAQSAYQLTVSARQSAGNGVVWDSGVVNSSKSQNVPYGGAPLPADSSFAWTVRWWDGAGAASSPTGAIFSTGLRTAADWGAAAWIGSPQKAAAQLRRPFGIGQAQVVRAHVHVVGLGYYKLFLDGERVSTHELGPFTTYAKRVLYDTWDVTAQLQGRAGTAHCLGVSLGDGWFSQNSVAQGTPRLLLRLSIDYADGSSAAVVSGTDWQAAPSPVTAMDIYQGETYDARMETPGWSTASFDAKGWASAVVAGPPKQGVRVTSHAAQPRIVAAADYAPCDFWESSPGVYVFDFCQNMAGITTFRAPEGTFAAAGQQVDMLHAEAVHGPKPAPVYHHYSWKETNTYISRGDGAPVVYRTQFVYAGFRYVQLTGYPGTPTFETLTAHFIHTDNALVGSVSFSDPELDAVQHITRMAAMSNFMSVPTDCPQRERRGWLGDAQLSAETNMQNFDMAASYTMFVQQIEDAQFNDTGHVPDCVPWYKHGQANSDPAWGAAYTLIADWVNRYYSDDTIVARHYAGLSRYVDALEKMAAGDGIGGLLSYSGWGDWCPPEGCKACWPGTPETHNSALVSSFYFLTNVRILARHAAALGKQADAARYGSLAANVSKEFVNRFYDPKGKTFREEGRTCAEQLSPQTMIALGMELGLVPDADRSAVVGNLVQSVADKGWHLDVGIVGIKYLLPQLSKAGRNDVALMIAQARTPPSWIYMVEQGATTLWETWTGTRYQPTASWNHIMFGSNSDWYFKYLAGLNVPEPEASSDRGWETLELHPMVWVPARNDSICANLSWADASIETARGLARSAWRCGGGAAACTQVSENAKAHLECPSGLGPLTVTFASFGTPSGDCAAGFKTGGCDASSSLSIAKKACDGKMACDVDATDSVFGDPCRNTVKSLALAASCGKGTAPLFYYNVTVPVGSSATVVLPGMGAAQPRVVEGTSVVWSGNKYVPGVPGVRGAARNAHGVDVQVGSGSYGFIVYGQ